jgi:hypothetical protein
MLEAKGTGKQRRRHQQAQHPCRAEGRRAAGPGTG